MAYKEEPKDFAVGHITPRSIVDEMQDCYIDYAMSVIIARALPDVRDGLKPVHRRILYAMWDIGLRAGGRFRKSATVVGEVLGKYHPHGDASVYDAMVRLAQDFAIRYPLVNGQGNFGSMDGDSPAAMRYTESKLMRAAEEMLYDIEKDTVDFIPNYDGTQKEPTVLPARLPNLLLNGTVGIAVGMATNIAPHNLTELCNGIEYLIDNPECDLDALMEFIKGPDFPTGGIIYNIGDIRQAYATGRGGIVIRAKTEIEETKSGLWRILITEVPYQVNKSTLIEKMADLVREKRIEGIKDIRDESNKEGVRVVIELKKDTYPKKILNQLFKYTQLQDTFHFNMLAIVDGIQPKTLTLKGILEEFIKHRRIVVVRRTEFDLARARERAHILEGLAIAIANIDAVIKTIKASKDKEVAKVNLIKKFKLSDRQAAAILEMRLATLANLESMKIQQELKDKKALIKDLETLLASPKKLMGVVKTELLEIRDKYGDDRRTEIMPNAVDTFSAEDLIPNESTIVMLTQDGYIKRLPPDTFKQQHRGGKGVIGLTTKEEDIVEQLFACSTHDDILFFTTKGRVFQMKAYDIPLASRTAKGQAVVNFLQLGPNEKVSSVLSIKDLKSYKYLMMVTEQGVVKKTNIADFKNMRSSGLIAIRLRGDDALRWVKPTKGESDIMLVTSEGQSIRFKEGDVRSMGRVASGVRGIRLKKDDKVIGMAIVAVNAKNAELLIVMGHGYGKRTSVKAYKTQGRGGSGIKTAHVTTKTGKIVMAQVVDLTDLPEGENGDLLVISSNGQVIRLSIKSVSLLGRDTQGVRLMRFKEGDDKVASVTLV
ncbi:MAG: DNA gyrase subunit A [bacterium]|nr:DNA gyrase subunit A [bacterium]